MKFGSPFLLPRYYLVQLNFEYRQKPKLALRLLQQAELIKSAQMRAEGQIQLIEEGVEVLLFLSNQV